MGEHRYRGAGFDGAAQGRGRATQRPRGRDSIFPESDARADRWGGGSIHDSRDDRGFVDRAGDEVRSWFGDEDAERRREADARRWPADEGYRSNQPALGPPVQHDEWSNSDEGIDRARGEAASRGSWEGRSWSGGDHPGDWFGEGAARRSAERGYLSGDDAYRRWRDRQIEELDHDYSAYRQERQQQFDRDFGTFRQSRDTSRVSSGASGTSGQPGSGSAATGSAPPSQVSALGTDGGDASKSVASGQTLGGAETTASGGKGGSGRSR